MFPFTAIWDTGATHSVISQNVVDKCGLIAVGLTDVHHAQGKTERVPWFLVNIRLPNRVGIPGLPVILGDFPGGDVLVGMDIIGQGDFAVTSPGGRTKFSYRIPSLADIDFVQEHRGQAARQEVMRKQSRPSAKTRQQAKKKKRSKRRR